MAKLRKLSKKVLQSIQNDLQPLVNYIDFVMKNAKFSCTNLQTAVALSIVEATRKRYYKGFSKTKFCSVVVPPAQGKTRIMVASIMGFANLYGEEDLEAVVIYYPNEVLME